MLPIVLAQFLKQFVPPVELLQLSTNLTDVSFNPNQTFLSVLPLNRSERSVSEWMAEDGEFIIESDSLNRFARSLVSKDPQNELDRSVSKVLLPANVRKSEKEDELNAYGAWDSIESNLNYMWNDIHWLATMLIVMTFLGFMFNHHAFCRQMIVGAQMRIALCSLIYRKVKQHIPNLCYS